MKALAVLVVSVAILLMNCKAQQTRHETWCARLLQCYPKGDFKKCVADDGPMTKKEAEEMDMLIASTCPVIEKYMRQNGVDTSPIK